MFRDGLTLAQRPVLGTSTSGANRFQLTPVIKPSFLYGKTWGSARFLRSLNFNLLSLQVTMCGTTGVSDIGTETGEDCDNNKSDTSAKNKPSPLILKGKKQPRSL